MKTPLRCMLVILALMLIIPAVTPANSPAQAREEVKAPPPPPTGISPADPDVDPPAMDMWRCPRCGAEFPLMGKRARYDRPQLGQRNRDGRTRSYRGRTYNRPGRGTCDTPGEMRMYNRRGDRPGMRSFHNDRPGMHSFHNDRPGMRSFRNDRPGMRSFRNDRPGMRSFRGDRRGPRDNNAAMRLMRNAERLKLTKEQVAKLEQLSYDTKAAMIDLRAAMQKEKLELQQLKRAKSDDLTVMKRHLKAIADIRVEIQTTKIANRIDAMKVLTDKQKELLEQRTLRKGPGPNRI